MHYYDKQVRDNCFTYIDAHSASWWPMAETGDTPRAVHAGHAGGGGGGGHQSSLSYMAAVTKLWMRYFEPQRRSVASLVGTPEYPPGTHAIHLTLYLPSRKPPSRGEIRQGPVERSTGRTVQLQRRGKASVAAGRLRPQDE